MDDSPQTTDAKNFRMLDPTSPSSSNPSVVNVPFAPSHQTKSQYSVHGIDKRYVQCHLNCV